MAVEETSSIDTNTILKLLGGTSDMSNLFGSNDGSGFVMGALLGRLLFNNNQDGYGSNRPATADQIESIQANNNAMLLLKDIQDSSQEVISSVNNASQTNLIQQLQNQIANLQGQGDIKSAIAVGQANIVNEIHESASDINHQINNVNTNLLVGFNNVTREINSDGDKTRALITANMITELNNEIADLRTRAAVQDNGINITNNINQQQIQSQQQQQIGQLTTVLSGLVGEIQRTNQSVVNLGTMTGSAGRQDAANTKVY